ncbi:MFS transporter [Streptomyces griseorubiginosus]|uniref:Bacillibactin exporter n=1 Tax=Streptomyces griseorubiginosus TaxID=67304 RepID=A0AAI8LA52_9ACTN|nr:MFS transporter [Streptomyces griseorubiginosus]AYC43808.1 Bacillibactin exporter [Streptomyces griseorubiginosus]
MTDALDRDRARTVPPPVAPEHAAHAPEGRRAGPAQLGLLLAGICLPVLGSTLIAPVLPQMQRHFAATPGNDVLVPMVLALPGLFLALTAPLAGFFADRTNRKLLLLTAMGLYSVVGSAPLYLGPLPAIAASRVLLGACEGVILTCCTTLIGDYWSGARRAKYLSLSTLASSLAATVFLALGGLLGVSGWRTPFWMYVLPLLLVVPMGRLLCSRPAPPPREAGPPWTRCPVG